MNDKPLISILIPPYNRPHYLKKCMDSILSQKGFSDNDLEIIVTDDSTNNDSGKVLEEYISRYKNKKIIYIKNEYTLGMAGNRNKLLELKKGDYFIFLSDDDKFYDENSLKILYDSLLKYKLDACYGKYMCIDENGKEIGVFLPHTKIGNKSLYKDSFIEQIIGHSISFGGILYKDYNFSYDGKTGVCADWDFNLKYLKNKKIVSMINVFTFGYRIHGDQGISNSKTKQLLLNTLYIYKKNNMAWLSFLPFIIIILHKTGLIGLFKFLFNKIKYLLPS